MKKIILLLSICFFLKQSDAQTVSCNYSKTQIGNLVNFQLPIFPLIYIVDSVNWDFGDGTNSFQAGSSLLFITPHTYTAPGTYNACLNIWLTQLGSSTVIFCSNCQPITISAAGPCNASYTFTQIGSNVNFTSTSSGPGTIISHSWNFGDGSPLSTLVNPTHAYAMAGTYNACHTIVGIDSSSVTFTCTFCDTITIAGTVPCNASFNTTQVGTNVAFTSTSTGPGPITSHTWVYGDGSPNGTTANTMHNYALPGTYIACHTIAGGSSTTAAFTCTTCDTIVIAASTPCVATAAFNNSNIGLTASFTNTSTCTGCITSGNVWNFGDGSPVSIQTNPSHTYAASGTYNVCLTVTGVDSSGTCSDTTCKTITVVGTSGTSDFNLNTLKIYPNPTHTTSYFTLPKDENIKELSVIDIAGRKIKGISFTANQLNEVSVDFSELQDGIYMVKVLLENDRLIIGKVLKN